MRSILILAIFGTLLLLPGVSSAETDECQTSCATEKKSSDVNCLLPDAYTDQGERAQCLLESQDTYNSCLTSCPQPEPTDTPTEK